MGRTVLVLEIRENVLASNRMEHRVQKCAFITELQEISPFATGFSESFVQLQTH